MDRLRLMEIFVRVVETGNFSAVARQANTTQSAISKQVQALEADVGVLLLVRSTRSHTLTEAGQLYYQRCRQVLETLEQARVEVHQAEYEVSGLLRVAAPVAFGSKVKTSSPAPPNSVSTPLSPVSRTNGWSGTISASAWLRKSLRVRRSIIAPL